MLLLNSIHMRHSPQYRRLRSKTGGILITFIGVMALCSIPLTPQKGRALAYGLGFTLTGAAMLSGLPLGLLIRRSVRKAYAKKPDKDLVMTYEFSGERLCGKSDIASFDLVWRAIRTVLRTADGFLLYVTDNQIHWLPVRAFRETDDLERFAQLAKAKVEDYQDKR